MWQGTEVGRAAADWSSAYREWWGCSARAKTAGWREALKLRRQSDKAAEAEIPLRERFAALAAPERARLATELPEAKEHLADLEGRYYANLHFQIKHPEALRRLSALDDQIATAAYELDVERQDLDGIGPRPPQLHRHEPGLVWGFEREAPGLGLELDRGIVDFGIGL